MKKFLKIIFVITLICLSKTSFASIEITEVMYDVSGSDTDREWLEVYNTTSSEIDLSSWYFFSDNVKHALLPEGSSYVPAGGYAVIVQNIEKFKMDWPDSSILIFDSSWNGLNNETGETISMKDSSLNTFSQISYSPSTGAQGDGNSLQKVNSTFISALPTPGSVNNTQYDNDTDEQDNTTYNTNSDSSSKNNINNTKKEIKQPIRVKIYASNNVTSKVPFKINAEVTGHYGESLNSGKFVWSFGDGMSLQEKFHKPFEYTYEYPGQYVLSLNFYDSYLSTDPDASISLTINVSDPQIVIARVGDYKDPFFEIKNNSNSSMQLSGWIVKSSNKSFMMPEGMFILPNKSIIFSSKITDFDINDIQNLHLFSPANVLVDTYPKTKNVSSVTKVIKSNPSVSSTSGEFLDNNKDDFIDLSDLSASVVNSKNKSYNHYFGLISLIVLGVFVIFFANKKSLTEDEVRDLNASDIKIIE